VESSWPRRVASSSSAPVIRVGPDSMTQVGHRCASAC
jgi:hypothetical protein